MNIQVVDISDIFWEFIHDVLALTHEQLSMTLGFHRLTLTDHAGFGLRCSEISDFAELDWSATPLPHGVYLDCAGRFIFTDVTSLLHNSVVIAIGTDCPNRHTQLLKSCLERIISHVDDQNVGELAAQFGQQTFS